MTIEYKYAMVLGPALRFGMPEERPQAWGGIIEDIDGDNVLIKSARRLIKLTSDGDLLRLEFDKVIGDLKLYNVMEISYPLDDKKFLHKDYKNDIIKLVISNHPTPETVEYMKEAIRRWGDKNPSGTHS